MEGDYFWAAVAVLGAMLLLARILHTDSEFGGKLDSLADIVSFGVAPAIITYGIVFKDLGILGWLVVILFPIAGAIRLALFKYGATKGYFAGLPILAAGGITAALVISEVNLPVSGWAIMVIMLAVLMVSRIRYPDIRLLPFRCLISWEMLLFIVVAIAVALINPKYLIFLPFVIYTLYGIKSWAFSKVHIIRRQH